MYTFGKSAQNEMMDTVDCNNLYVKLQIYYDIDDDKIPEKVKKEIKDIKKFQTLCDYVQVEQLELIDLIAKMFPELFNHRLIKFIRKTYIFPED